MEKLNSIIQNSGRIKHEYPSPIRKSFIIADEQISGFYIRKMPPDIDSPVLKFPALEEDIRIHSYITVYSTKLAIDIDIIIKNDIIKKGETTWICTIKLDRERTSAGITLRKTEICLNIVIGRIQFVSNPFVLHTNQTQVENRTILNVQTEKTSNPRSAIHNSLLIIKNTVDNINRNVILLNRNRLNIKVYIPNKNVAFGKLLSKLGEMRGIFIVYNENLEHDMVLIQKNDTFDFKTDKKIITEDDFIDLLNTE